MNNLDKQYQTLLQTILDFGVEKKDRTGTGTKSIFGYTIRHNMKDGFPLLTTKKMAWKTMVTELLWFLRGDTNIKYLVDNNCHIWDGDAYQNYCKITNQFQQENPIDDFIIKTLRGEMVKIEDEDGVDDYRLLSQEEFINKIKTDDEFAYKWGDLGPVYGAQWRSWHWRSEPFLPEEKDMIYTTDDKPVTWSREKYIDQIANLISELKTNPDSRRLMVNAWNVGEIDKMVLPPCHYGFQVYTRELSEDERNEIRDMQYFKNRLHQSLKGSDTKIDWENIPTRAISLMWNQRSVDTFLGLPFNIASYGLLLTMIADEVNMIPDELIGNLGDTHIYLNHIEQAKEQIGRERTHEEMVEIYYQLENKKDRDGFWTWETRFEDNDITKRTREPYDLPKVSVRDGIFCSSINDVILENYQSHPAIKAPLSN
jgi:thymidylate synthase